MFLQRKFGTQDQSLASTGRTSQRDEPRDKFSDEQSDKLSDERWDDLAPVVRDVFRNIQILLSSRRGHGHLLENFGLSGIQGSIGMEARLESLLQEIPETLGFYEPRFTLTAIEVDVDDDDEHIVAIAGVIQNQWPIAFEVIARTAVIRRWSLPDAQ